MVLSTDSIDDPRIDFPLYTISSHTTSIKVPENQNITHLGGFGIFKSITNITIAYVDKQSITNETLEYFEKNRCQIDILLTFDWPLGIQLKSSLAKDKFTVPPKGSELLSQIVLLLKPRYHFASGCGIFFEREPFANLNSLSTRFIGLGDFGNVEKERWFYAMNLLPFSETKPDHIKPTSNPFGSIAKQLADSEKKEAGFFWNDGANKRKRDAKPPEGYVCKLCNIPGHYVSRCPQAGNKRKLPDGYICRICNHEGHHITECPHAEMQRSRRPKRDGSKCWFCLSNDVETHLIVTIISDTYVSLAKGGLVENHMLIVPVMHYSNSRELELITDEEGLITVKSIQEEISKIKTEVESVFRKKGQCVVYFEVFGGGDQNSPNTRVHHMHIQMVPIPEELEEMVEDAFKTEAENEGLIAQEALPESSFWPFIRVHLFGRTPIVFTPPEPTDGVLIPFNLQMARFVLANLIGKPEYANWKRCILEEDEETAQAESLRNILSLE